MLMVLAVSTVVAKENTQSECQANPDGAGWICSDKPAHKATSATPRTDRGTVTSIADSASQLDWVPLAAVPKELQEGKCLICEGRYIDPLADADLSVSPDESDIEANATDTTLQGNTVTLSGGVEVTQGYRQLRGETATFDRETRSGTLEGNISLREPGVLFRGKRADFDSRSGEASIDNSQFVLHELHIQGSATQLRRDELGRIHMTNGNLSYCAPDDEDWNMRAKSMELDLEEGVGTARGAKIELGGVPVLYIPWIRFPLDDSRRTGILWPSLGSDSKGGVDIAVPVYLNLGPNYDALYLPRYIQERGLNHELTLRYLNSYIGEWAVGGSYMAHDKRYEDEFPDDRNSDRWLAFANHDGLFGQRWRSKVDYAKASDVNYLKDLDTSSLETKRQTSLLQLGSVDYLGDDWLVEMEVQQFQSLADDINNDYKKLPQITARYRSEGTPFALEPILLAQYSNFDTNDNRVTGQRIYGEMGAGYPMNWGYGFLNPVLKYRQLDYDLSERALFSDDDKPSTGAAMAKVDGGLFFERQANFADRSMVQTLEPRIYYLYSEFEDQTSQPDFDSAELTFSYNQLFRETRFSGRDRIDDSNQVSVGLTTRFIGDTDGQEYFSASLGQIFYFDDRRVRLNPLDTPDTQAGSELAAELNFQPNPRFGLRSSLLWDPYSGDINAGNVQASYTRDNGSLYNAGYTYRRPATGFTQQSVTEQFHLSTYMPVWNNWSFFAAWNYSIEADTSIEDMVGLEYDTCCWQVRLLHLRYFDNVSGEDTDFNDPDLERESSTQVQIVLKGMGGFGSRVTGILQDMIRGFDEREY
jgi:LPS-assembly protein